MWEIFFGDVVRHSSKLPGYLPVCNFEWADENYAVLICSDYEYVCRKSQKVVEIVNALQ